MERQAAAVIAEYLFMRRQKLIMVTEFKTQIETVCGRIKALEAELDGMSLNGSGVCACAPDYLPSEAH